MTDKGKDIEVKKSEGAPETPATTDVFNDLRQEMNRVFDNFLTGFPRFPFGRDPFDIASFSTQIGGAEFRAPAVDVTENDTAFHVTAELPGLSEGDVSVSLNDGMLTIKGEKKEEREEKADNRHLSERRFGSFQRSFRVPANVDVDKISGNFSNGVLALTLPKGAKPESKERKIEIKAA
mgnify:CR=1 FL=1